MTVVGLLGRGFADLVVVEPNKGRRGLAERLGALRGSFAYRPKDFDEALALLAARVVPTGELVTSRHPLAAAAACFAELRRPGTDELKLLLT